jgi:hypothetical protein
LGGVRAGLVETLRHFVIFIAALADDPNIRVSVNLVQIDVSVTDSHESRFAI